MPKSPPPNSGHLKLKPIKSFNFLLKVYVLFRISELIKIIIIKSQYYNYKEYNPYQFYKISLLD